MLNVQSVSLGTGNYSFLLWEVTMSDSPPHTEMEQNSQGQLYYLLFVIHPVH